MIVSVHWMAWSAARIWLSLCPPMTYVHHEVTGEGEGAPNGDSTCVMTKDHAAAFKKVDNP